MNHDAAAAASPPAVADPQDPLPESNWIYRRRFIFAAEALHAIGVGIILAMLYGIARAALKSGVLSEEVLLAAIEALYGLGWWLMVVSLVDRVLYLIAPSAEQATKMMATVSAWKGGVSTASTARSRASDGSTAEATTTAGPAASQVGPAPPAPATIPATEPHVPGSDLPEYAR